MFVTFLVSECGHVANQIKGKKSVDQYASKVFYLTHTDLWVGLKGQIFILYR